MHPRVGKWMLWLTLEQVDKCWAQIDERTRSGRLGISAKRATAPNDNGHFLVCVYTLDYADMRDVSRVLGLLRRLGHRGKLLYKEDAATRAGVYGSDASLYVSPAGSDGFARRRQPVTADGNVVHG